MRAIRAITALCGLLKATSRAAIASQVELGFILTQLQWSERHMAFFMLDGASDRKVSGDRGWEVPNHSRTCQPPQVVGMFDAFATA